MGGGLLARIVAPVVAVCALAIALSMFLNYSKFARTFGDIEHTRFQFVANDVRTVIEGGLDLGVPLANLTTVQTLIADKVVQDPQILGIIVFDMSGQELLHSGQIDTAVPPQWLDAVRRSDDNWREHGADFLVAGVPLSNDSGQTVGGVAVLYSQRHHDREIAHVGRTLALAGLTSAAAAAVIAYAGVIVLVRRLRRQIDGLEAVIVDGSENYPAPGPAAAARECRAALAEIASVQREIESLKGGLGR